MSETTAILGQVKNRVSKDEPVAERDRRYWKRHLRKRLERMRGDRETQIIPAKPDAQPYAASAKGRADRDTFGGMAPYLLSPKESARFKE